jgi:hypothetical protein
MTIAESKAKGKLYRIMDFARVVQIFESKSLYFAHPSSWDDPYEQRLQHSKSHAIFAQCWCQSGISDAMWRIYSPHGLGVRISTTKLKLAATAKQWAAAHGYGWEGREVEYESQRRLNQRLDEIREDLSAGFDAKRAADALFLKREAFQHEDEWRGAIFADDDPKAKRRGISVPIDPHALIDNILLNPRAPAELNDALGHYFRSKLAYARPVKPSVLYQVPKPMVVDDEDL